MGRRRRRRHSAEFKAAVIEECLRPGVSIAAVALAHGVEFQTIAQGIEDPSSLERARNSGCDLVQGFYLGLAEAAEELDNKIASGRSARHAVFH